MYDSPTLERFGTLRELTEHKKKKHHPENSCSVISTLTHGFNQWGEHEDDDEHGHLSCLSGGGAT